MNAFTRLALAATIAVGGFAVQTQAMAAPSAMEILFFIMSPRLLGGSLAQAARAVSGR